jgi:hypothetical protein
MVRIDRIKQKPLGYPDPLGYPVTVLLADLFVEASVIGIICIIFLILFVVAGIKQIINDKDRD